MCGLFSILGGSTVEWKSNEIKLSARGPEDRREIFVPEVDLHMVFHRLKINGLNDNSSQPFYAKNCYMTCNGEIYNHKELELAYDIHPRGNSDCEVIIYLYKLFGFEKMLKLLDGVFSIFLYDENTKSVWIARDRYGVRQLFIGLYTPQPMACPRIIAIASEAKALCFLGEEGSCRQIGPGTMLHICAVNNRIIHEKRWTEPIFSILNDTEDELKKLIGSTFFRAVKKRTMSDRPIGCLLSGGFDSSIIASVLNMCMNPRELSTFSIGLEGSPDLLAARTVASYLGTNHHEIVCTPQEMLNSIVETVKVVGSYDVTTIRASVWHLKVCQWIRDNTDVKVVFSGDFSDEMFGSYLYLENAPSNRDFQAEVQRLLADINYFDNLRSDHCISACGLESRIPFADKDFMQLILSVPPRLKMFGRNGRIEKQLMREAFVGFLPEDILFRRKNAFSDGVSLQTDSWSTIIQRHASNIFTNEEFEVLKHRFTPIPATKEALLYVYIYSDFYPTSFQTTPYQWLPKWCGSITDPSARVLTNLYKAD